LRTVVSVVMIIIVFGKFHVLWCLCRKQNFFLRLNQLNSFSEFNFGFETQVDRGIRNL
jgi:hypothetical protein